MKLTVIHIFFWVLVMWAVHSHGRAYETESIIYNNTQQPYKENLDTAVMRRVTFHYLVMFWRSTYNVGQGYCNQPGVRTNEYFVVHGLWPQLSRGRYVDCTEPIYRNRAPFNVGQLSQNLRIELNYYWWNYRKDFWQHEYEKHGSCVFGSTVEYFQSTMWMMHQIHQNLHTYGIAPNCNYSLLELRQKFLSATGVYPKLQCRGRRLSQVYFCANKSNVLFSCDSIHYPIGRECSSIRVLL